MLINRTVFIASHCIVYQPFSFHYLSTSTIHRLPALQSIKWKREKTEEILPEERKIARNSSDIAVSESRKLGKHIKQTFSFRSPPTSTIHRLPVLSVSQLNGNEKGPKKCCQRNATLFQYSPIFRFQYPRKIPVRSIQQWHVSVGALEGGRAIRQALMTFRLAEVNRREHTVAEVENRVLERG